MAKNWDDFFSGSVESMNESERSYFAVEIKREAEAILRRQGSQSGEFLVGLGEYIKAAGLRKVQATRGTSAPTSGGNTDNEW